MGFRIAETPELNGMFRGDTGEGSLSERSCDFVQAT